MVLKVCGIILALLLAGLAYIFYKPLPEGAKEPWKQLLGRSVVRIIYGGADIAEKLGYSGINFTRALGDGRPEITPDETIDVTDSKFDGVDVRIYKPRGAQDNGPGLVYIHGGGWIFGTIASYDHLVRRISKSSGFVTISIGYRRAPEHPFPAPFEDCLLATAYFMKNANRFGVDPTRIGIVGDSAGGNLAAAVTLKLSKEKDTRMKPKLQALIYPALQALDLDLPAYRTYNDDSGPFILAKPFMTKFWLNYGNGNLDDLSDFLANNHLTSAIKKSKYYQYIDRKRLPEKYLTKEDKSPSLSTGNEKLFSRVSKWLLDPYFAPLMASDDDLNKLPPTYILTAEYDPLRDDGFLFASRLKSLHKDVLHTHYDGLYHAFVSFDFLEGSGRAIDEMIQFCNMHLFEEDELVKLNLGI